MVRGRGFGGETRWRFVIGFALAALGLCARPAGAVAADNSASPNAPVAGPEAVGRMKLPEGFSVSLFAAEPDVVQPIAMTIDHKGRLWVVENYSYPIWLGGPRGQGPHLDFRRCRPRRPVRSPDRLLRQRDQLHRDRAGLRRGLGMCHAQPTFHSRPRRRRPARRPSPLSSSTAGILKRSTICSMH